MFPSVADSAARGKTACRFRIPCFSGPSCCSTVWRCHSRANCATKPMWDSPSVWLGSVYRSVTPTVHRSSGPTVSRSTSLPDARSTPLLPPVARAGSCARRSVKRRLRSAGNLTVYFLFRGSEPLELTVAAPVPQSVRVNPVNRPRAHTRLCARGGGTIRPPPSNELGKVTIHP